MKLNLPGILAGSLLALSSAVAELVPVTSDIAAGTTVTWRATNEYRLDTVIYVQTNATLVIEPGTVIKGATNVVIGRDGLPELVSALWVTRGGKLIADGTKEAPIIFTAEGDNLDGNLSPTDTSLWGGVVLMGRARINSAKDTEGNVATPKFDLYEGVNSPGPNYEHAFGGDDDADSSGTLRYVSVRHAGRIFAPAAELNCLTLGAVGSGTVLEYVEVYAGSDDGFEWWGGTVSSKYLVAGFIEDDDFDTDQGYRGSNQFWFGIKPPWSGTADSRGIESDGDLNQSANGEQPLNAWSAWNVTLVGRGAEETSGGRGVAWNTRDEDAANVANSIFTAWNQGLRLDADGLLHYTGTPAAGSIRNNIWDVTTAANTEGAFVFDTAAFQNSVGSAMLGPVSYANDSVLDPRPLEGSPAFIDVLAGAPQTVNYRGAFSGPTDDWADGWTALSRYGYLKPAEPVTLDPIEPVQLSVTTSGENVSLSFPTQDGIVYRIFTSTDLVNWQPLSGRNGTWYATGADVAVLVGTVAPATFYNVVAAYE